MDVGLGQLSITKVGHRDSMSGEQITEDAEALHCYIFASHFKALCAPCVILDKPIKGVDTHSCSHSV